MLILQSHPDNKKIPYNSDNALLQYEALLHGEECLLIDYNDIDTINIDVIKNNLCSGSVEFMKKIFSRIGVSPKLPGNSNRIEDIMTLGEAKDIAKNGEKIFIKPLDIKLFTGFVLDKSRYPEIEVLPLDTMVITSKPFDYDIISETRIYVYNDKIVHIGNYSGDFVGIDIKYILYIISENIKLGFPDTYTIDIGTLSNGTNVVIEYNDMWAIGNYGVDSELYKAMLERRYLQIIKQ